MKKQLKRLSIGILCVLSLFSLEVKNVEANVDNNGIELPGCVTEEAVKALVASQKETGYPASVGIAQIIQESTGSYGPGQSKLAYNYHNLFGIKGTGPAGSINMQTGEEVNGVDITITDGFRVYHSETECVNDRQQILQRYYSDLIDGFTSAEDFAKRIGSRWATDSSYAEALIARMKEYNLTAYDSGNFVGKGNGGGWNIWSICGVDLGIWNYRNESGSSGLNGTQIVGTGQFCNPCPGATLTSTFGYREFQNEFHKGIDLGTGSSNLPTLAVADGVVVIAGWSDSAGNWVVIDHGNGLVTKYMHHISLNVKAGDSVKKGQQIGLSGNTGNSFGNHLHFQVEVNDEAVDPKPYFGTDSGITGW